MEYLQLHYYLQEDWQHSIDAFHANCAETELLKIFKEVVKLLDIADDVSFETIAIEEGGIKAFYKIIKKKKNQKKILFWVGTVITGILINVVSKKLEGESELEKLQKQELQLKIELLKREINETEASSEEEIQYLTNLILAENKIKIFRSNFYLELLNEPKIDKFSTQLLDQDRKPVTVEESILRTEFKNFVIQSTQIDPTYYKDKLIEIVAPILKKGPQKWKGQYEGKPINFNLKDNEFRESVLNGEVTFASNMGIICDIEFEQSIDSNGEIKVDNVNVYNVTEILMGAERKETKKKKYLRELSAQIKIDFSG